MCVIVSKTLDGILTVFKNNLNNFTVQSFSVYINAG